MKRDENLFKKNEKRSKKRFNKIEKKKSRKKRLKFADNKEWNYREYEKNNSSV